MMLFFFGLNRLVFFVAHALFHYITQTVFLFFTCFTSPYTDFNAELIRMPFFCAIFYSFFCDARVAVLGIINALSFSRKFSGDATIQTYAFY